MQEIQSIESTILEAVPDAREYRGYVSQAALALGQREQRILGNLIEVASNARGNPISEDDVIAAVRQAVGYTEPVAVPATPTDTPDLSSLLAKVQQIMSDAEAQVNEALRLVTQR